MTRQQPSHSSFALAEVKTTIID